VATHHKVEKNDKVAIITTDNFRADSSQQIKSFCRILGCPCGIVYNPEELSMAIKSQPEGLILIDTPGVNPNDSKEIGELLALMKIARLDEIQLVVSASTPARDVEKMLKVFGEVAIDKVLITKLDETEAPGGVVSAVINNGVKLSYICGSREIPGRFTVAAPESLADALTSEKTQETPEPNWEMEAVGIWQ
jgi:flagellar biosynthesis protein FlhF